jgi:hypothetical protein
MEQKELKATYKILIGIFGAVGGYSYHAVLSVPSCIFTIKKTLQNLSCKTVEPFSLDTLGSSSNALPLNIISLSAFLLQWKRETGGMLRSDMVRTSCSYER